MSSGKWRPPCLGLNVLKTCSRNAYGLHDLITSEVRPGAYHKQCFIEISPEWVSCKLSVLICMNTFVNTMQCKINPPSKNTSIRFEVILDRSFTQLKGWISLKHGCWSVRQWQTLSVWPPWSPRLMRLLTLNQSGNTYIGIQSYIKEARIDVD